MSNSIAPGSSADVNIKVTALTTNPNVPAQYKTVILKKNLVNGVNTLTQAMMSAQNTKYVVKYDYVLGEDITVPINCILCFEGGSITANGSNYTITGDNTGIEAGLIKIFNTDITLAGTWKISEAYAKWFGDNTSDIQKAISSFKGIVINVDGEWSYDSTVTVPYNTSLVCRSATCNVTTSSGRIFIFYCGQLAQHLDNFTIFLSSNYKNDTCIDVYGIYTAHSDIPGYLTPAEKCFSDYEIHLPAIKSPSHLYANPNNVIGVHIHAIEAESDILYFKKIYSYAFGIHTHVRIDNTTGLNGAELNITSWWCINGLSLNQELNASITVNLTYQVFNDSNKVITIDSEWYNKYYPGWVVNEQGTDLEPMKGGCTYNIALWDPLKGHIYIDNVFTSVYNNRADGGNLALDNLSAYFNHKDGSIHNTKTNTTPNIISYPKAIKATFMNIYELARISGSTHIEAVSNMINYFRKLCLGKNIFIELYVGLYSPVSSPIMNDINKFIYEDGETPITNYDSVFCKITIELIVRYEQYERYKATIEDYSDNLVYETWVVPTVLNNKITSVRNFATSVKPYIQNKTMNIRPTLDNRAAGYSIIDSSLTPARPIYWTGTTWVDATGATV